VIEYLEAIWSHFLGGFICLFVPNLNLTIR